MQKISEKYLNDPKNNVETKENILRNIDHSVLNIKQADKYENY